MAGPSPPITKEQVVSSDASMSAPMGRLEGEMDESTVTEHVKRVREAHPSLDERLERYRERRKAYESLRDSSATKNEAVQKRRTERRSLA
jgi:hypothetical protein